MNKYIEKFRRIMIMEQLHRPCSISKLIILAITNLIPPILANNDLTRPLVPMSEYRWNEFRTLNCWECFEAQGKMCHHEDYIHNVALLESGNWGDGACCKINR